MTGRAWDRMDPTEFDRTLGSAKERRMIARMREMPDTLLPELSGVTLPYQADPKWAPALPPAPPVLDGQLDLLDLDGGEPE